MVDPHRGPLVIHASATAARDTGLEDFFPDGVADLPRSAIVGVVDLVDITREESGAADDLFVEYHWHVANPRAFAKPVAFAGKLRLFEVHDALVPEIDHS
jgi:hypothetical protein